MSKSDFTPRIKQLIRDRASDACETMIPAARCQWKIQHYHHRKLRSQGGMGSLENGLGICSNCHSFIHANPELSYQNGWLVKSNYEPSSVSVLLRGNSEFLNSVGV